ncbi:MAG TPA: hypothetical protein VIR03_03855 [Candidatus Saccharimonadales bacterium]
MASGVIYRNVRSRDQLELFLLAAVSSLLLIRLYLYLTGYPQIGSGGLHIAHMLWGGALMLAALITSLTFLGARSRTIVALLGGAGFGIFIDELGKFITRDNNYFYKPTVGLIYAIFAVLYLIVNFLSRKQTMSSRECQLNALSQLEEVVARDLDPIEKARVMQLLSQADPHDPITRQLLRLLNSTGTIPRPAPKRFHRFLQRLTVQYEHFWRQRHSSLWVQIFFLAEVALFVLGVLGTIYNSIDSVLDIFQGHVPYATELVLGQLASSIVAAGFAVWGALLLTRSRLHAYEQFRRATLINLFLTQFFMFSRIQFGALPAFAFNMILLGLISYAIRQEHRLRAAR